MTPHKQHKQVLRTAENDAALWLAEVLREARMAAGFATQEALADEIGFDRSVVSKAETGDRPPTDDVLKAWCKACHLDYRLFSGFAKVARAARGEGPTKVWFADYIEAEGNAHTIRVWQPTIFPGLFQVPEYAMPLFLAMGKGEEWAREQLEIRTGRQGILDLPEPPTIVAVLDESVLHRKIGTVEVMRRQLAHVLELSERPNAMIHILPFEVGANAGLGGAVHLAAGHGIPEVLGTDALVEGQITSDPVLVVQASDTFNLVRSDALPRVASRVPMTEALDKWNSM